MADYKHGAYGQIQAAGSRLSAKSTAFVYVGTAPVHNLPEYAGSVNTPILVNNIAEAKKYFGYSDDWASYTLCEAMHVHFEVNGVGPLVMINVLNPAVHKETSGGTASKTPADGRFTITSAESIVLKSVKIMTTDSEPVQKVLGTDYTIDYDERTKVITVESIGEGLGTDALSVTWDIVDPSAVDDTAVIGADSIDAARTGLYSIYDVYGLTGYIPSFLLAPGFSASKTVHDAMKSASRGINGHYDAYMFVDLPILSGGSAVTMTGANAWKTTNGYTAENETVFFPMASGTDGNKYHLSVLAAANMQNLLVRNDNIPYMSVSNTPCEIIESLYLGDSSTARTYDYEIINKYLNQHGISSAAFVGGRWAIWGCHSADYDYMNNATTLNAFETNRMMLFYICNDFQKRRLLDVDRPMTANALKTIASEEQARLDALVKIGALILGEVYLNATSMAKTDIMAGDFSFTFNVTCTPLAKSLTAVVNWTERGFETYIAEFE